MQNTKIEWTDKVWNVTTGCCHNCSYCYAKRLAETRLRGRFGYPKDEPFRPIFHPVRLEEPKKVRKPTHIFVSSMSDLFGDFFPNYVIKSVFKICRECPQHTFIFLTKNPRRYFDFDGLLPGNSWFGTTVDCAENTWRIEYLKQLRDNVVKFISFEPLLTPVYPNLQFIDWIIIGAQTGPGGFKPPRTWIDDIKIEARNRGAKIFEKNNLYNDKSKKLVQEFPS